MYYNKKISSKNGLRSRRYAVTIFCVMEWQVQAVNNHNPTLPIEIRSINVQMQVIAREQQKRKRLLHELRKIEEEIEPNTIY